MIISSTAEKPLDKIQHLVIIKTLNILDIEGISSSRPYLRNPQLKKKGEKKSTAGIIQNSERLKPFPLKSGTKQGFLLSLLLFSIVLEVLVRAVRQEKEVKSSKLKRKK